MPELIPTGNSCYSSPRTWDNERDSIVDRILPPPVMIPKNSVASDDDGFDYYEDRPPLVYVGPLDDVMII
jgi:hypothetical protein